MKNVETIIPEHKVGVQKDTIEVMPCKTEAEAVDLFQLARLRMLDVNCWGELCHGLSSDFMLHNGDGIHVQRPVTVGDYIRIDIPGPGGKAGKGYDWVHVVAIEHHEKHDAEWTLMQVRPASNPLINTTETAHFLDAQASSTFVVARERKVVRAEVHARNEVANTDGSSTRDKIRNTVISWGAWLGFADVQWNKLAAALVQTDENKTKASYT